MNNANNTENKEKETFVSDDDISKALSDLNITPTKEGDIDNLVKGDDGDDDDKKKKTTNAKVEGEGDGDGEMTYKAYKAGDSTYYRKMKGDKAADEKYYKKGDDGKYTMMNDKEVAGMNEARGGADKFKSNVKKGEGEEGAEATPEKTDEEKAAEAQAAKDAEGASAGEGEGEGEGSDEDIEKALESSPVIKSLNNSLTDMDDANNKKFQSVGTLLKGLMEEVKGMREDISTAQPRKSVGARPADRFGNDPIVKGGEGNEEENILSLGRDKGKILDIMEGLCKGDLGCPLADAMGRFEGSGEMTNVTAIHIQKESGFKIIQ